jgi:hypothetical protein
MSPELPGPLLLRPAGGTGGRSFFDMPFSIAEVCSQNGRSVRLVPPIPLRPGPQAASKTKRKLNSDYATARKLVSQSIVCNILITNRSNRLQKNAETSSFGGAGFAREPGIQEHGFRSQWVGRCSWIPGPALKGRPERQPSFSATC